MTDDDEVVIGRVGRPHGLAGSFVVEEPSENEALFAPGATLLAGAERVRVEERKRSGGRLVIRLDRSLPRGTRLTVPRAELPDPDEGRYYVFQLVGLRVIEEGGRVLGTVRDIAPGVANDVLELDSGIDLPMHEQCVRSIDLEEGEVVVAAGFADG